MTTSQLSNLIVLKSFINDRENTLNSLLPFVEHAIADFDCEWIDFSELKEKIKTLCLLDIPTTTLRTLLKTLKGSSFITGYEDWSKIQVVNNYKIVTRVYKEKLENANRDTVYFLQSCKEYCEFVMTDEEMSDTLYSFLNVYQHEIDISNGVINVEKPEQLVLPEQMRDKCIKISDFIIEVSSSDSRKYCVFKNIFSGFLLSQFIRHVDISDRKKVAHLDVLIDSNFILRVLDLQAPPYVEASKELLTLMQNHEMVLWTLPEIVSEVKQSIRYQCVKYEKDKNYYNNIYGNGNVHKLDGIIGSLYRRNLQPTEILDLENNIERSLKTLGIDTREKRLPSNETNGWLDSELQAIVRNKLSRAQIDISSPSLSRAQQSEYEMILRKSELDESVLTLIRNQRNYKRVTRLDQCRTLFLTCDNTLYHANNYQHKRNGTIPECLNEITFTNTLYMHNPGLNPDTSIKSLVAIFKSSSYLNYDFIDRFHESLATHMKDEPDDKQYLSYMFHNQSMFTELVEQQEEDNIASLINTLLEDAKATREAELTAGKKAMSENEKLMESITQLSEQLTITRGDIEISSQGEITALKNRLAEAERKLEENEYELKKKDADRITRTAKTVSFGFWGLLVLAFILTLSFSLKSILPITIPFSREMLILLLKQAAAPILLVILAAVVYKQKYLEDAIDRLVRKNKEKSIVKLLISLAIDVVGIVLANILLPLLI